VQALAALVEDHQHFTELLRACEPTLRRDMYESMSPHLRFKARPLESYVIAAKEHAAAAELPTIDGTGNLQPYTMPTISTGLGTMPQLEVEVELEEEEGPEVELFVQCSKCDREGMFWGERLVDAIEKLRHAGWAYDSVNQSAICWNCLEEFGS
jgi:hypothetical protein